MALDLRFECGSTSYRLSGFRSVVIVGLAPISFSHTCTLEV
jgi:hypothetical protein